MRVLVTSAGRRVSLLNNFKRAAAAVDPLGGHAVFAVDLNPEQSAACQIADGHAEVPRASEPDYVPRLLELCLRWDIDVVVPTIDTELVPLAEAKPAFADIDVAVSVSSPEICRTLHGKRTTAAFFENHGFPTPAIIDDLDSASFPLFAKLDDSSRSVGAGPVESLAAARALLAKNRNYVFQELIIGHEFTVDAFVDSHGAVLGVVPRMRVEVRDGEVSKGLALKDQSIVSAVRELCACLPDAYGALTIQLFKRPGGELSFVEVNARFGGGYPLSMHAGADFALYLLRDVRGEPQNYNDGWRDRTLMLRYDAEAIVHDHRL